MIIPLTILFILAIVIIQIIVPGSLVLLVLKRKYTISESYIIGIIINLILGLIIFIFVKDLIYLSFIVRALLLVVIISICIYIYNNKSYIIDKNLLLSIYRLDYSKIGIVLFSLISTFTYSCFHNFDYDDMAHIKYIYDIHINNMFFPTYIKLTNDIIAARYPLFGILHGLFGANNRQLILPLYYLIGIINITVFQMVLYNNFVKKQSNTANKLIIIIFIIITLSYLSYDNYYNYGNYPLNQAKIFFILGTVYYLKYICCNEKIINYMLGSFLFSISYLFHLNLLFLLPIQLCLVSIVLFKKTKYKNKILLHLIPILLIPIITIPYLLNTTDEDYGDSIFKIVNYNTLSKEFAKHSNTKSSKESGITSSESNNTSNELSITSRETIITLSESSIKSRELYKFQNYEPSRSLLSKINEYKPLLLSKLNNIITELSSSRYVQTFVRDRVFSTEVFLLPIIYIVLIYFKFNLSILISSFLIITGVIFISVTSLSKLPSQITSTVIKSGPLITVLDYLGSNSYKKYSKNLQYYSDPNTASILQSIGLNNITKLSAEKSILSFSPLFKTSNSLLVDNRDCKNTRILHNTRMWSTNKQIHEINLIIDSLNMSNYKIFNNKNLYQIKNSVKLISQVLSNIINKPILQNSPVECISNQSNLTSSNINCESSICIYRETAVINLNQIKSKSPIDLRISGSGERTLLLNQKHLDTIIKYTIDHGRRTLSLLPLHDNHTIQIILTLVGGRAKTSGYIHSIRIIR